MQDVQAVRISTQFPPALLAGLDAYRRGQEEIPSRAEAIRQLCEQALGKASSPAKPRKAK
jgi:metal-responsive CopG/Arc/MetJ family transcriptional regulator